MDEILAGHDISAHRDARISGGAICILLARSRLFRRFRGVVTQRYDKPD
jgi:hypothetical protein